MHSCTFKHTVCSIMKLASTSTFAIKLFESLTVRMIVIIYNPGQNIWHKVKIYSKIGQVISNFSCFLIAIVNV